MDEVDQPVAECFLDLLRRIVDEKLVIYSVNTQKNHDPQG